ncbi:membrane protein [Nocardioides flavus (ex Wang et al. 2016)]|uniref:Membrane protein n=1 Tax=Nocardioides flavus (ex Wang et al. 2016) TaxID=2058780 RepID=A0ABQ3HH66_9ACTN|nr:DUF2177 family protein [Nocardioides flavus (ex Wang et al. 2016)]GHE15981.1 membrane protein [Nocardioides flavus (ex Wang et al. 2016)]
MSWVAQYVVAAAVFCVLDLVWLGTIAEDLYDRQLGDLLAPSPDVGAAVVFYAIFIAGLVYFVIRPAVEAGSWRRAAGAGAFFGLVTYATWDLTSLAVIRDFPAALVPIDLAWGTFLAAAVSLSTYALVQRLPGWARGT